MSVELDPIELGFRRPFTREVAEVLRLRNPGSESIAFKVKTTAPKQYCVRPNSGRIEAGEVVEVSVLLQPMKKEPPLEARCRDKFLVQTVAISASNEIGNVSTIWANIEQTAKSSIQEKKIRVNFLPANGSAATGGLSTPARSTHTRDENPPAYSSPALSTPQQHSSTDFAAGAISTPDQRPAGSKNLGEIKKSAFGAQTNGASPQQSTFSAAADSIASVIPSTDDVKAQFAGAQATISGLTASATDGLRQRKADAPSSSATGGTAYGSQQAAPSGVPVPIVAALCLLSFLLAYLLF